MFEDDDKPKDVATYGHGRVYCSCGKALFCCGCHFNYGIKVKACKVCISPLKQTVQRGAIKSKKRKTKGKVEPQKVSPKPSYPLMRIPVASPITEVMSEKELRKALQEAKERAERRVDEEEDWYVEQEIKNEK